jgi:hypothetical protein
MPALLIRISTGPKAATTVSTAAATATSVGDIGDRAEHLAAVQGVPGGQGVPGARDRIAIAIDQRDPMTVRHKAPRHRQPQSAGATGNDRRSCHDVLHPRRGISTV